MNKKSKILTQHMKLTSNPLSVSLRQVVAAVPPTAGPRASPSLLRPATPWS